MTNKSAARRLAEEIVQYVMDAHWLRVGPAREWPTDDEIRGEVEAKLGLGCETCADLRQEIADRDGIIQGLQDVIAGRTRPFSEMGPSARELDFVIPEGPLGVVRIASERVRQIESEGWTAEHDDQHKGGEMAQAAACYAIISGKAPWPWDAEWDKRKKHDRIRQLEIAGALIAAEIDRLLRKEKP